MKVIAASLLWAILFLFSCHAPRSEAPKADSTRTDSIASNSSAATTVAVSGRGVIKLVFPMSDKFGLIIPSDKGVPLYSSIAMNSIVATIHDTTQVQTIDQASSKFRAEAPCAEVDMSTLYKVSVQGKTGWLKQNDFLKVDLPNIGVYSATGRTATAAMMAFRYESTDDYCASFRTIVLYDNQNLYFVDVTSQGDPTLHAHDQPFLSLVDFPSGGGVASDMTGENLNVRWGVPNGKASLSIAFDNDHFVVTNYEMKALESDVADLGDESGDASNADDLVTAVCVFRDYGLGDCSHIEFDCGDFGDATFSEDIPDTEYALWKKLGYEDESGNLSANPDYAGKTFEIMYRNVPGQVCGAPDANGNYEQAGQVPMVFHFKLKAH